MSTDAGAYLLHEDDDTGVGSSRSRLTLLHTLIADPAA